MGPSGRPGVDRDHPPSRRPRRQLGRHRRRLRPRPRRGGRGAGRGRPPRGRAPLVFTKCGLVWEEGGTTVSSVGAAASIRRECEGSLHRLGVDVIDLLQMHWPAKDGTQVEETWSAMADLVEEGKVRYIGVSNFDVELLEACEAWIGAGAVELDDDRLDEIAALLEELGAGTGFTRPGRA